MKRLFFIAYLILFSNNLFAQVANASASATIVTPVGAEISGTITNEELLNKSAGVSASIKKENQNEEYISLIKIIGETFSHHVSVENEPMILYKKTEGEEIISPQKHKMFVRVTVNFD